MSLILHEGDCLDIMSAIPNYSIDMILCDLPYEITARNRWDKIIPFAPLWGQWKRIRRPGCVIISTAVQPFTSMLVASNLEEFRYTLVWEKSNATGFLNAKKMPLRAHEDIVVFYDKLPTYNPQKTFGHVRKTTKRRGTKTSNYGEANQLSDYDSTERYPKSVLKFASDKQKSSLHPTQKPLALMEYLIRTYTNEGDTVLDNCMGSGTTGLACLNTNRDFIGIEKDPMYFKIAKERLC
jgi:DNA modification methylase